MLYERRRWLFDRGTPEKRMAEEQRRLGREEFERERRGPAPRQSAPHPGPRPGHPGGRPAHVAARRADGPRLRPHRRARLARGTPVSAAGRAVVPLPRRGGRVRTVRPVVGRGQRPPLRVGAVRGGRRRGTHRPARHPRRQRQRSTGRDWKRSGSRRSCAPGPPGLATRPRRSSPPTRTCSPTPTRRRCSAAPSTRPSPRGPSRGASLGGRASKLIGRMQEVVRARERGSEGNARSRGARRPGGRRRTRRCPPTTSDTPGREHPWDSPQCCCCSYRRASPSPPPRSPS